MKTTGFHFGGPCWNGLATGERFARKPGRSAGKKLRDTGKPRKISGNCSKGNCWGCYSLNCPHDCHNAIGRGMGRL